jgi:hypothetical protein
VLETGRAGEAVRGDQQAAIILTDEIVTSARAHPRRPRCAAVHYPRQGERASRRFIEFFTANIRNRNTRMAYARAVKAVLRLVR